MCIYAQFMHIVHKPDLCMNYNQHQMLRNISPNVEKHLGLSSYAISSRSEPPKTRNRPMCICAQFMHIVYAHVFNCAWPKTTARCCEIFRTAIICNTESIRATKLKKIAKKIIFALFCTFYAHYAHLINYAWTKTSSTFSETFRTIIICNIESIRATKVEKNANVHICTIYAHCA